jgi:hypothetical protein
MKNLYLSLALVALASLSARADVFTYIGPVTDNSWSDSSNWTDTTTGGTSTTGYPSTTSDTANVGYAASNTQTVIYDVAVDGTASATNGALGTLNLTSTGTGLDELDYQKYEGTIQNSFALGSATGTVELLLDSPSRAQAVAGYSDQLNLGSGGTAGATLTVNAGGILELRGTVTNSDQQCQQYQ